MCETWRTDPTKISLEVSFLFVIVGSPLWCLMERSGFWFAAATASSLTTYCLLACNFTWRFEIYARYLTQSSSVSTLIFFSTLMSFIHQWCWESIGSSTAWLSSACELPWLPHQRWTTQPQPWWQYRERYIEHRRPKELCHVRQTSYLFRC